MGGSSSEGRVMEVCLTGPSVRRTITVTVDADGVVILPDGVDSLGDGVWEVSVSTDPLRTCLANVTVTAGVVGRMVMVQYPDLDHCASEHLPRLMADSTFSRLSFTINSAGGQVSRCSCGQFHVNTNMTATEAIRHLRDRNVLGMLAWLEGVSDEVLEVQGFRDQAEVTEFRRAVEQVLASN